MFYRYDCEILAQIPHPTLDQFCEIKQINFSTDKARSLDSWFLFYLFEPEDPVVISYFNFGYLMLHPGTTRFIGTALRPDGPHWIQARLISDRKLEMPLEGIRNVKLIDSRGGETDWNWDMRYRDPVQQWAYEGCFRNEQEFKDDRNQLVLDILGDQKWRLQLPWHIKYTLNNLSTAEPKVIDINSSTGLFASVRQLFKRLVPTYVNVPAGTDRNTALKILEGSIKPAPVRLDQHPNDITVYTLADPVYWRRYAAALLSSIMHNTDHCLHIHMVNPSREQVAQAKLWQEICQGRFTVSADHDVAAGSYSTWWGAQRFIKAAEQQWQQILIVDIDSVFRKNMPWPKDDVVFYPEIANTDVPGRKVAAGCTFVNDRARELLQCYVRLAESQDLRKAYADQIVLENSIRETAHNKTWLKMRTWDRSVMGWHNEPNAVIWTGRNADNAITTQANLWQSRVKKWIKRYR